MEVIMNTIDEHVLAMYNNGIERGRLRKGLGLIEFARTKEILADWLPPAPAVIYDIGGGYGEYAWWLASLGYEVHLFDLSETNILMSAELACEYPGTHLAAAEVCDARSIPRSDASADAILLMGPLYHLTNYSDRKDALRECRRLLLPGAPLFVSAITPYAPLLPRITTYGVRDRLLDDIGFLSMVTTELRDGRHVNDGRYGSMRDAYFHTFSALRSELADSGFCNACMYGTVGAAWLAHDLDTLWQDPVSQEALLRTVRMLDGKSDISGLSTHFLAVSRR